MKRVSPALVTESVTIVAPGCSSSTIAASSASRRLRFIGAPPLPTMAARSQSASRITPASAPLSRTMRQAASIAAPSSGLGMWFGNRPSGSRNWLPAVSAPRGSSTSLAKNPPEPLPASTAIFRPARGLSPRPARARTKSASRAAYCARKSTLGRSPTAQGATGCMARARSATSSCSRPPSFVTNFMPLRS